MNAQERQQQKALAWVRRALQRLGDELARHRAGCGQVGTIGELETFRSNLLAMEREIEVGSVSGSYLGMGRVIVDSWPWDSTLGEALLAAEQEYRALLRQDGVRGLPG